MSPFPRRVYAFYTKRVYLIYQYNKSIYRCLLLQRKHASLVVSQEAIKNKKLFEKFIDPFFNTFFFFLSFVKKKRSKTTEENSYMYNPLPEPEIHASYIQFQNLSPLLNCYGFVRSTATQSKNTKNIYLLTQWILNQKNYLYTAKAGIIYIIKLCI